MSNETGFEVVVVGAGLAGRLVIEALLEEGMAPASIGLLDSNEARASDAPGAIMHAFPGRNLKWDAVLARAFEGSCRRLRAWREEWGSELVGEHRMMRVLGEDWGSQKLVEEYRAHGAEWDEGLGGELHLDRAAIGARCAWVDGAKQALEYGPAFVVELPRVLERMAAKHEALGVRRAAPTKSAALLGSAEGSASLQPSLCLHLGLSETCGVRNVRPIRGLAPEGNAAGLGRPAREEISAPDGAEGGWVLELEGGGEVVARQVVLAMGVGLRELMEFGHLRQNWGELVRMGAAELAGIDASALEDGPATGRPLPSVGERTSWFAGAPSGWVVTSGGHMGPMPSGEGWIVGSTYLREDELEGRGEDEAAGWLRERLGRAASWVERGEVLEVWRGSRLVCGVDRRPVAGQWGEGRWVLGALGSKGLLWAPMLAVEIAKGVMGRGADIPEKLSVERLMKGEK